MAAAQPCVQTQMGGREGPHTNPLTFIYAAARRNVTRKGKKSPIPRKTAGWRGRPARVRVLWYNAAIMIKRIGIIGSGRFGEALVQALAAQGAEVVLMDTDRGKIQELSDYVTKAIEGDAANIHALEEAGFASCDTVVVAIGENVEGSIMATVNCKDLGVRTVVAKASTEAHGRVLRRVGADVVIFPNRDRAQRLARSLLTVSQVDLFEIADGLCAAEVPTPDVLAGKTLAEADVRRAFDVTVLAIRRLDDVDPAAPRRLLIPQADTPIRGDDHLLICGASDKIDDFAQA